MGKLFSSLLLVAVIAGVAVNYRDIARYMRMRTM
jgi:hypothetical protein